MGTNAKDNKKRGVISMRLIVTVVTVTLVAGAVLGVGAMAERNVRNVLTEELETRMVLEARNLAMVSSSALLGDYPELILHPVIKGIEAERPDLAVAIVVDRNGVILGHADAALLGTPYKRPHDLTPIETGAGLVAGELLFGNGEIIVVEAPIRHASGESIGTAIVGLERSYIDALVTRARRSQIAVLILVLFAAMVVTPVLVSLLLRPIGVLRGGLNRIGQGDFDIRLRLSSRTELGVLADSINDMAARLKAAQIELFEKERLDHEMDLARDIQRSLLPDERLEVDDYLLTGAQKAADEVGGDYYDVFPLDDNRLGLLVADVAGKGLSGCLVTSMIAVLVRTLSPTHTSPSELLVALHESLDGSLQPGTFVTIFYGILDPSTGDVIYASAGHNPVLKFVAESGRVERHDTRGIPVGLITGEALRGSLDDVTLHLAPGDVLVQYTDGFHEAVNGAGEEFGLERMMALLADSAPEGNDAVRSGLQHAVDRWEGALPAADDKTLLVVSRSAEAREGRDAAADNGMAGDLVAELWAKRPGSRHHFTMPATLGALDEIGVWLRRCAFIKDFAQDELGGIEQGLYEVASNIVEHGYDEDSGETVDIWWVPDVERAGPDELTLDGGYFLVRDHGRAPNLQKWAQTGLDIQKVRTEGRGLGLPIINQTFASVELHPGSRVGNLTVLRYKSKRVQPI